MNYSNGVIKYDLIKGETVLCITLAKEGMHLESNIGEILKQYSRYITAILFKNIDSGIDLVSICNEIKRNKLKAVVDVEEISGVSNKLLDRLDYLIQNGKIMKRDYCPFADAFDWVDLV